MKDSPSEHKSQNLNARLLRFRSHSGSENPHILAEDLIAAERYADARGVAIGAQPKDREDGALLVLEGRAWLLDRDLVRAQAVLMRAVRAAPELALAYRWLGQVLLKRGDPERAAKTLQRALALAPDDVETAKLAARAEYLAEAGDEGLAGLEELDPPEESAQTPRRSLGAPAADGGESGPARGTPQGLPPSASRRRASAEPPASISPNSMRTRPARETAPMVDARDERLERPRPAPKPSEAELRDRARPSRAGSGRIDEPTSEFRRVPAPDDEFADFASEEGLSPHSPHSTIDVAPRTLSSPLPSLRGQSSSPAPRAATAPGRSAAQAIPGLPPPAAAGARAPKRGIDERATRPLAGAPVRPAPPRPAAAAPGPPARDAAVAPTSAARTPAAAAGSPTPRTASDAPGSTGPTAAATPGSAGRIAPGARDGSLGGAPSPFDRAATRPLQRKAADSAAISGEESEPAQARPAIPRAAEPVSPAELRRRLSSQPSAASSNRPAGARRDRDDATPRSVPAARSGRDVGVDRAPPARTAATSGSTAGFDSSEHGRRAGVGRSAPAADPSARSAQAGRSTPAADSSWRPSSAALSGKGSPAALSGNEGPGLDVDGRAVSLPLGADLQQAVDPDQVLALVRGLGLLEENASQGPAWSLAADLEPRGQRLRNALIGLWVVTLLLCVGGYFGWHAFVAHRHENAARLVDEARALMLRGDHGALIDAERMLRLAREQHPASVDVPRETLILQAQRVLEDGERDMAALRSAFVRAHAAGVTGPVASLGTAILSGFSGEAAARDRALGEVLASVGADPRLLYLVGRYELRAGTGDALTHLQAALKAEPKLVPVDLALAEAAYDSGDRATARSQVAAALALDPTQLRARLFALFVSADDAEPSALESQLRALAPAMEKAGDIDRALDALVRARIARREGHSEAAGEAVERASNAGADEPRLLSWIAHEALAAGKLSLAQHVASAALSAAPDQPQQRRLLARILIERGDGEHALQLLDKLPVDDVEAQIMRAQAALLSNEESALQAALDGLTPLQAKRGELATRVGALHVRLEAKLTPGRAVIDHARALVRAAPGDPEALLALAEAGLAARDPAVTQNALKQRFAVTPDDPNAHYLLGRARRMAGDATGAEASFRRALELAPGHAGALNALAALLLDEAKFADADAAYQELATRGGSGVSGRLGRVDALIGLARLGDAQVQLDAVPEAQHNTPAYHIAAARLALARNRPGDALSQLRPLVDTQAEALQVMPLYGDALIAAQQNESAAGAYDAALALDPELPEALLGRADVQLRLEHANDALPLLQRAKDALAQRIRPAAMQARRLTLLGQAYVKRNKHGDMDAARDALREAVAMPSARADAYFWLAEALGGKQSREARSAYEHYRELEPQGRPLERAHR